ncbi:MAG: DUF3445 domain-containing protein, partial [Silicimonas sp.]|nr:DUF3445 domain-containing protein [Silicimonas sp.]
GTEVTINPDDPLHTLGHLICEDLCLLQKRGERHALTGAVLCFPAGWTLAEKIDRPLDTLHGPVAAYDDNIARRVQRLLDGVRIGHPIWRANLLPYADPALYQPRREADKSRPHAPVEPYERSERQVLWRLPKTGAVVFVIHTSVTQACQAPQSPL